MREKADKLLAVVIVLALLALPMRFVQAAVMHGSGSFTEIVAQDSGMGGCAHAGASHQTLSCDRHSSSGDALENCCGENCTGAQMALNQHFDSLFVPATVFDRFYAQQSPDFVSSAKYRPPIAIS
ncbi:MAG: hypothetical protein KDI47_12160 [Gammaproteobacteria bacterium]|nr:hypothetical protein [Gammaproteobacteria bacterium]MCB1904284.1 hypothetical protein [Gammaproteobacteria bacterium]